MVQGQKEAVAVSVAAAAKYHAAVAVEKGHGVVAAARSVAPQLRPPVPLSPLEALSSARCLEERWTPTQLPWPPQRRPAVARAASALPRVDSSRTRPAAGQPQAARPAYGNGKNERTNWKRDERESAI